MLEEGKRHRAASGTSLMVPRYDIVPIPPHLRTHLSKTALQQFTAETAQSMYDFRADDVIGKAAGRPILLLHSSVDSVTPTEQSIEMFPAETAQSMYDFRADDVVGKIAPRPLLLIHAANDSVTPTEQSVEMFKRAKQPTDLHLFAETDHFMFAESNTRVRTLALLQQNQRNHTDRTQQMKNYYDCFQHFFSFPRRDRSHRTHLHSGKPHQ